MLLLLLACTPDLPEGPPPAPRLAPLDTGRTVEAALAEGEGENRPPRIKSVNLHPRKVYTDTDVEVRVNARDPDGDMLHVRRQWYVNGQKTANGGEVLSHNHFSKDMTIEVEVTVYDGQREVTRRSEPLTVLNTPPKLTPPSQLPSDLNGLLILSQDLDGDSLSWRVEDGPEGLGVDSQGRLSFSPPTVTQTTVYRARVIAEDTSGASATWPLTVTIGPPGSSL